MKYHNHDKFFLKEQKFQKFEKELSYTDYRNGKKTEVSDNDSKRIDTNWLLIVTIRHRQYAISNEKERKKGIIEGEKKKRDKSRNKKSEEMEP